MRNGRRAALLMGGIAASLALPGTARCQILDSEIPLTIVGAPDGVRDRVRPELAPTPLQVAGIAVSATLNATVGSTSNVHGAQDQRRADGFVEWAPQLVAALDDGPDRSARIVLDYDGKRFWNTRAKAQDGYHVGASGLTGLGRDGSLYAAAFHRRIYEDQLAGSFPANGGGAVAIDQTQGQTRLAQGFNRLKLIGTLTYDRLVYHDTVTTTGAVLAQSYRDDSVLRASARADYTLLADTALFAQGSWRRTDFAADGAYADRSSREWRVIAGVVADVTGLIRLSAGMGGYWRRYLAPPPQSGNIAPSGTGASSGPDFDRITGLAWDLRGVYYVSTLTTLSLQAKREFVDANIRQSPGYDATSVRLTLDHEFLRNLLLSVSALSETDRFRLVQRADRLHDYAVWGDVWLSRHVLVTPRCEWLDRASRGHDAGPHIPEIRTQLTLSLRN